MQRVFVFITEKKKFSCVPQENKISLEFIPLSEH